MNFEELYEKYQKNTATPEERAFVESEIAKARKLAAIIDEQDAKRVIAETDEPTARSSVKRFLKRTKLRVAIIVIAAVMLLAVLLIGGTAIVAHVKASDNTTVDREAAIALCEAYLLATYPDIDQDRLFVGDVDRELSFTHGFSRVYYEYEIEFEYSGREYEFWVDAASGTVRLIDID